MLKVDLNRTWKMRQKNCGEWIEAKVPGSVMNDLMNAGKAVDPFYRDNEDAALELASYDYEYERNFEASRELLGCDRVVLCCEGLDTLAEIQINGRKAAGASNMHRTYEFDAKPFLEEGLNNILITFFSPLKYIAEKQKEHPTWGTSDAVEGFQHIRKAHCMFGWDWGPKIPDAGIWRDIYIKGYKTARLQDVYIAQKHACGKVSLEVETKVENWAGKTLEVEANLISPRGEVKAARVCGAVCESLLVMDVENPEFWWPNGYGGQPLYRLEVLLKDGGMLLDRREFNIGLRTLTVKREKDRWGESFAFEVNGVSIFAMGADYIPEDSILARCSPARTERLIKDCIEANFNCIRVWGGGIYPPDYFYDLCDKYGLIVWQDLMFACAVYAMTDEFSANISEEAKDNIKRIRHHACLGLLCGNNEMEWGWEEWSFPKTAKLRTDYIKQFEILLPQVAKETAPDIFYWPASPSSGGGFDNPNDENRGDVHYWEVWHGLKPFTEYRKHYFRFCSEFGFQSFPCLKTVEAFTLPEDRNIFSYVMERHQKNGSANGKILFYLSDNFKYPKDFDSLLYVSQILQAEAIKYGVEHWRRNRGRCMGAIYWQLNDCWPVASWASIDYYGRWKALHYYAKRFFAPVLLSAKEEGTSVELHVSNETAEEFKGVIKWALRDNKSQILREGFAEAWAAPLSSAVCTSLDFSSDLKEKQAVRKTYFEFSLESSGGKVLSRGTVLFAKEKYFEFAEPKLRVEATDARDRFVVKVRSESFARHVELDLTGADCVFDDNYFDLTAGEEKRIEAVKDRLSRELTLDEFRRMLKARSIYDID